MINETAITETAAETVAASLGRIQPADTSAASKAQQLLDGKTKPRRSLAGLEDLACRIASIRRNPDPGPLAPAIVVVAADHGYAEEGVSAYPQEVTAQMVANFASGGAAICVLAKQAGSKLVVVDAGTVTAFEHPGVESRRIGNGTRNATKGPAMTPEQTEEAIASGIRLASALIEEGAGVIALGEMGIANSTAAAALAAALLPADAATVCGPGTGVDDAGVRHKVGVVKAALEANRDSLAGPLETLASVGGFEIATLTGIILGAAALQVPVVLDGFITGAAALVAARMSPDAVDSMIAGHRSPEPGASLILENLGLQPLLEMDMRLGEGSGAALALPIISASLAILKEMATFDDAGVTDAGA